MSYTRSTTIDDGASGDTGYQAIMDLDTDMTGIFADLNTHEALTVSHGATGAIVGTTNTQTLTNKTLSSPTLTGTVSATQVKGMETLLSTTTVSFAADGDTTLYTVPSGCRCVLTKAIIVAAADAGTTVLSIGQNGAETDFISPQSLTSIDAQYDATVFFSNLSGSAALQKSYAATTVIQAQVTSHAGSAGNTIYLFGILY